jgi:major intracellular serine protease
VRIESLSRQRYDGHFYDLTLRSSHNYLANGFFVSNTHITGTLVACNNEIGIVGVAPKAKVMPVKCLDADGNGNMNKIAEAIHWAADQGVDFISMSLGCPMPVKQIRAAIQYAVSKGVVFFCAAGNVGNTKEIFYPAAYPETIAIGAVDAGMRRAKFSNTGFNLDFMAPGVDILSTVPESWYAKLSGTSMAAPFACGVAALVLGYKRSRNLDMKLATADDYKELFRKYTTPINNGNYDHPEFYQGFGIIDPRKYFQSLKT